MRQGWQMTGTAGRGESFTEMRRAWLVCLIAGLAAILLRLALLPALPIRPPIIHDEFTYLLGADTFAQGRVTNPPHPMWVHFETFHINQQPTYCSIYPPAQALFLGFGQVVFGNAWYGVALSVGLMFAAICWMLQGWVSAWCAMVTTLLCILGWGFTGPWVNAYWGGAVAAAGGALVIGAIPRIVRRPAAGPVLAGSAGLVVLANSRPFEGALTAVSAGLVLLWQARRSGRPLGTLFTRQTVAPFLLVMIPAVAAIGYYNYRTTGNPTLMPYNVYERAYATGSFFYLLPMRAAPVYRHENIRQYWTEWALSQYTESRAHPGVAMQRSAGLIWDFYLYTPLGLAMLAGLLIGWGPQLRAALAIAALPILGLMCGVRALPHYMAPVFGSLIIVAALGIQRAGQCTIKGRPIGSILVVALVGIALGSCIRQTAVESLVGRHPVNSLSMRPQIVDRLERMGGKHLVIVRYGPKHGVHEEWVYNRADIDGSNIVWAQDMGDAQNQELLDYYRGRKVWLFQPDTDPLALAPYPGFTT